MSQPNVANAKSTNAKPTNAKPEQETDLVISAVTVALTILLGAALLLAYAANDLVIVEGQQTASAPAEPIGAGARTLPHID